MSAVADIDAVNWVQEAKNFVQGPGLSWYVRPLLDRLAVVLSDHGFQPLSVWEPTLQDNLFDRVAVCQTQDWRHPDSKVPFVALVKLSVSPMRVQQGMLALTLRLFTDDAAVGIDFLAGRQLAVTVLETVASPYPETTEPERLALWLQRLREHLDAMTPAAQDTACVALVGQLERVASC